VGFFDYLSKKVFESAERIRTYWYVIEGIDFVPNRLPNDERLLIRKLVKYPETGKRIRGLKGVELARELVKIRGEFDTNKEKMRKRCEGWNKTQDGISNRSDAIEFRRSGFIPYFVLTEKFGHEKAVDVKLATDLITLKDIYDIAVIVSGDQDFVPAVQVIKDVGKRVVNIAFKDKDQQLLPGGAWRLQKATDKMIAVPFEEFEPFIFV